MTSFRKLVVVAFVASCGLFTIVMAAQPNEENVRSGNSYHLFTKALHVEDSAVIVRNLLAVIITAMDRSIGSSQVPSGFRAMIATTTS